jgi:MFS family permease
MFGSLILASLPNKKRGLMLLSSTLFLGLMLIVFSFSKSWGLTLGVMVFIGLGQTGRFSLSNTLAQNYSNDKFRGRVMGIFDMQMSFPGLAVYAAGVLTGVMGVEWAIGGLAIMLVAFSLVVMLMVPRLRRLE